MAHFGLRRGSAGAAGHAMGWDGMGPRVPQGCRNPSAAGSGGWVAAEPCTWALSWGGSFGWVAAGTLPVVG